MAGTIVADTIQADSTSTLVLKNGVANTPPTIQDSAGTQIGTFCRAWVNFNGTTNVGGFCTIRASFNVTSVADNGTGSYTVNFTNAMPDTNYSVAKTDNFYSLGDVKTFNTTNVTVQCYQAIGSAVDTSIVCAAIFR
jgi:hypothetical protein